MWREYVSGMFRNVPEMLIYLTMVLAFVMAALRCFPPVRRNTRMLRRAARLVVNESKLKIATPSWNDVDFLGKGLREEWARFLQNAELMDAHGEPCDVEEYINADTAVYNASHTQLAELTPGVMVSLGILGTFWGIVMALRGISLEDPSLITQTIQNMIGGMFTAFLTSICGIVFSLIFNYANRYTIGRAEHALDHFLSVFRQYAMPRPADANVKLLTLQQEQNQNLKNFVEEVSLRTAAQIEQAILRALLPVQRSMDNFIVAATREQVEGMDRVAARFVERMNLVLDGQFIKLGETLAQLNANHLHTQSDMQATAAAVSAVTQEALQMRQHTQELFAQMEEFLQHAQQATKAAEVSGARSAGLLEDIHAASVEQAQYLAKINGYQSELQDAVQQFARWSERILEQTRLQSKATDEGLAQITTELQDSAALLQSSYASFVENIQAGLARALSMLDENITGIAKDLNAAMNGIHATTTEIPALMAGSARKYGQQVDQFVSALAQLQRSMQAAATALEEQAARREVV